MLYDSAQEVIMRLAFVFLLAAAWLAQEFRGTILGHISDPSGASVDGAAIEVRNQDTNTATKTQTNGTGNYQAPFLLPGNYTVVVEVAGFKKVERQGVRVSTNCRSRSTSRLKSDRLQNPSR